MTPLNGRVLITGATGGLGQAIARAFAAEQAQLILSGRRREVLEPFATELGATPLIADLGDRAQLTGLLERAGDLDVVVANAALPGTGLITELTQPQIDNLLEVNLGAQIALAKAVLPGMLARRRGHLVFIASLSGKVAAPQSSMYSATKFGLRGFALGLREDLYGTGVSCSLVSPGFVSDAGMFADSGVKLPPGVGTATPQEVAEGVLRAVRRNRTEVCVAPRGLRVGAAFGQLAPTISSIVQRRSGGAAIAHGLAEAQRDKRPDA